MSSNEAGHISELALQNIAMSKNVNSDIFGGWLVLQMMFRIFLRWMNRAAEAYSNISPFYYVYLIAR